jgi:uracil-DNA glycosylase family 4
VPTEDQIFFGTSGPRNARIMVIGEAWGQHEAQAQAPLVGQSGQEFTRMLLEANINRNDLLLTNVVSDRPPHNEMWQWFEKPKGASHTLKNLHPSPKIREALNTLHLQIVHTKPDLIIGLGNYPLWALTSHAGHALAKDHMGRSTGIRAPTGIMTWRGSQTYTDVMSPHGLPEIPYLPIIHPAAILRQWELRNLTVHDLKARVPLAFRSDAWDPPPLTAVAPPSYIEAYSFLIRLLYRLNRGELHLSVDIETARPLLVCIGLGHELDYAMSIPFIRVEKDLTFSSYWTIEEEATLIGLLRKIFRHSNVRVVGQNFIYDTQYIEHELGVTPRFHFDTMLAQHLLFPGMPKGLDYLSSLYCKHHLYWKDDGKDWHIKDDLPSQLRYNCVDIVKTLECFHELDPLLDEFAVRHLWQEELDKHHLALRMMRRGVNIDLAARAKMRFDLMEQHARIQEELLKIMPQEFVDPKAKTFWFHSAQQSKVVLYEMFGLKPIKNRKTGTDSTGKEALAELSDRYPRLKRVFDLIGAMRSVGVFQSNFLNKSLEPNNRMVCSFNPGGTETFRWSSSENAFGRGTNLQNIPSGNEE